MLNKFIRKDKQFLLNFSAVIGVGLTMALAIKDTTKAVKLIDENMDLKTKIKKTWRCYIPSSMMAASTMLCIMYSDYTTMNQKISLLNALISTQARYKNLRENIEDNVDQETRDDILKKTIRDKVPKDLYIERTEDKLFYEEYRGKFFVSTIDNVLKAEYLFNKHISIVGSATLNDFYKFLGISETDEGKYVRWDIDYDEFCRSSLNPWVDFIHRRMETDDGSEYYYINYSTQPDVVYA